MKGRSGFTLIEVTVALAVAGLALAGASALLIGLQDRTAEVSEMVEDYGRRANVERTLRDWVSTLDLQRDSTPPLVGDEAAVAFRAWCASPRGWPERCTVELVADTSDLSSRAALVARITWQPDLDAGGNPVGEPLPPLQLPLYLRGDPGPLPPTPVELRYLVTAESGGDWAEEWNQTVPPPALAIVQGPDTLVLPRFAGS